MYVIIGENTQFLVLMVLYAVGVYKEYMEVLLWE